MSGFQNVSCIVAERDVEAIETLFNEQGALAVTVSAARDDEQIFDRHDDALQIWQRAEITALFAADVDLTALMLDLHQQQIEAGSIEINHFEQSDWVDRWRHSLTPIDCGSGLWICPDAQHTPAGASTVIRLKPGMAFGTGSHPTTAMCLAWLAEISDWSNVRVLDFGCGSGILAIAAAKLGADAVTATDVDPEALLVCGANVEDNGLDEVAIVLRQDLRSGPYDVVVANVLLEPLIDEFEIMLHCTIPGSRIAMSGILIDQAERLLAVYQPRFTLTVSKTEGEWVLVSGIRV